MVDLDRVSVHYPSSNIQLVKIRLGADVPGFALNEKIISLIPSFPVCGQHRSY